jgi:hypothetical protein
MIDTKLRIQFKEDGKWKTLCVWLERDKAGAEVLLRGLRKRYEDARIIDYRKAVSNSLTN